MRNKLLVLVFAVFILAGCGSKQEAVVENQDASKVFFQQAMVFLTQGKIPEAVKALEKSAEMSSGDITAHFALAQLYMKLQAYDNALIVCQKILDISPSNPDVYLLMAGCFDLKGDLPQAIKCVKTSKELFEKQNNAQGVQNALEILKKLKEPDEK